MGVPLPHYPPPKKVGTTPGTVAAGDDSRFTDQIPASRINISTWANSTSQALGDLRKAERVNLREFTPPVLPTNYDWALALNAYSVAAKERQFQLYGNSNEGQLTCYFSDNLDIRSPVLLCRAAQIIGENSNTSLIRVDGTGDWTAGTNVFGSDGTQLDQIYFRNINFSYYDHVSSNSLPIFADGGWTFFDCTFGTSTTAYFNQVNSDIAFFGTNAFSTGEYGTAPADGMAFITLAGGTRLQADRLQFYANPTARPVVGIRAKATRRIYVADIFARRIGTALELSPGAGQNVRDVFVTSVMADSGVGENVVVNPTAGGTVTTVQINQSRVDIGTSAVAVRGTSGAVSRVEFGSIIATAMTSHGVILDNSGVTIGALTAAGCAGDGVLIGDTQNVAGTLIRSLRAVGNTGYGLNNARAGNTITVVSGVSTGNTAGDVRDVQTATSKTLMVQTTSGVVNTLPSVGLTTVTGNPTFSGGAVADSTLTVGTGNNTGTVSQGFVRGASTSSTTTNGLGADLRMIGGQGRGTGRSGNVTLESGPPIGTSGTTINGLSYSLTLDALNGRIINAGLPVVLNITQDPVFLTTNKAVGFKYASDTIIQVQMRGSDGTVRNFPKYAENIFPGPYANDAAAATALVGVGSPYRRSDGVLVWRVS